MSQPPCSHLSDPMTGTKRSPSLAAVSAVAEPHAPARPVLRSEDVLSGHRAVEILHAGVRYRLSVTAMGKLILTK